MAADIGPDRRRNPLYRLLYPERVADVADVRHVIAGRLRLGVRRSDAACLEAVAAALRQAGGMLDRPTGGPAASLVVRFDPAAVTPELLLGAGLPPLPMPPPRLGAAADVAAPATAVWEALTAAEGPPWCPPAMLQVTPLDSTPPSWQIAVKVGPWTLPHFMETTAEQPPHLLELSITGKLNGMIRYEVTEQALGQSRLTQSLWFAIDGSAAEIAMGEGIVQQFARRFADEQVRDIAQRVGQTSRN
jgi:carbon monoxide dehydrogenase subunit G